MLGNRESARRAFREIEQLSSADRTGKNDIIAACIKYCVYLKGISSESLTPEESEFMRTMEEIDAWYAAEITNAERRGKLQAAKKMIGAKFQGYLMTENSTNQIESLNDIQLDELMLKILSWQQPTEMIRWLSGVTEH
jgi:hypothetical protein